MEPEKKKAPKETEIDIEALKDVCGGSALDYNIRFPASSISSR